MVVNNRTAFFYFLSGGWKFCVFPLSLLFLRNSQLWASHSRSCSNWYFMELFASDNLGCVCTHCNDWLFFLSNCLLRLCYFAANAIVASPPRLLPEKQPTLPTVVLSLIGSSQYIVALSLNILGADVNRCLWHLLLPNKIPNLDEKHCQRHNGPIGWHHNWRHLVASKFSKQMAPHGNSATKWHHLH